MNEWLTFKIKDGYQMAVSHVNKATMFENFKVNFEKPTNNKKNYLKLKFNHVEVWCWQLKKNFKVFHTHMQTKKKKFFF